MRKEDVFKFSDKVKCLLKLLDGIEILCSQNEANKINNLIDEIKTELINVSPSPYEEYSIRTKILYFRMIKAKKEYEKVKRQEKNIDIDSKFLKQYNDLTNKYNISRQIRDTFKNSM